MSPIGGGGGIGGGVGGGIGGAIGGPIGGVIGSWVGRTIGNAIRGRRSPEEFVTDMIEAGRVPEFLRGVVTFDRLVAAEEQSRGAGWALDRIRDDLNATIERANAGNWDAAINGMEYVRDHYARMARERPNENLVNELLRDAAIETIAAIDRARQQGEFSEERSQEGGIGGGNDSGGLFGGFGGSGGAPKPKLAVAGVVLGSILLMSNVRG